MANPKMVDASRRKTEGEKGESPVARRGSRPTKAAARYTTVEPVLEGQGSKVPPRPAYRPRPRDVEPAGNKSNYQIDKANQAGYPMGSPKQAGRGFACDDCGDTYVGRMGLDAHNRKTHKIGTS